MCVTNIKTYKMDFIIPFLINLFYQIMPSPSTIWIHYFISLITSNLFQSYDPLNKHDQRIRCASARDLQPILN